MRDGHEVNSCPFPGLSQPLPKVLRVFAVVGAVGKDLFRCCAVNRGQHNPVQVFSVRLGTVLPTDQGGEYPWRIVPVGGLNDTLPVAAEDFVDMYLIN